MNLVSSLTSRGVQPRVRPGHPRPAQLGCLAEGTDRPIAALVRGHYAPGDRAAELNFEAATGLGWYVKAVVTLTADDGPSGASGVATTDYRIDGGD